MTLLHEAVPDYCSMHRMQLEKNHGRLPESHCDMAQIASGLNGRTSFALNTAGRNKERRKINLDSCPLVKPGIPLTDILIV